MYLQLFDFYANLFAATQQLNSGARTTTFSDTAFANTTLCFGEILFLFRDLGLYPHLISRAELRYIFEHMDEVVRADDAHAHLTLPRFVELLTRVFLTLDPADVALCSSRVMVSSAVKGSGDGSVSGGLGSLFLDSSPKAVAVQRLNMVIRMLRLDDTEFIRYVPLCDHAMRVVPAWLCVCVALCFVQPAHLSWALQARVPVWWWWWCRCCSQRDCGTGDLA